MYPLMLYRDGTMTVWDGRDTDYLIVENEAEHADAIADGWLEAADYLAPQQDVLPTARRGRPPKAR